MDVPTAPRVHVARIGGAAIVIHPIWIVGVPLLGGLLALSNLRDPGRSMAWGLQPAAWALSVLLHEAGHALAGRAIGIRVSSIRLMPAGGVTVFDRDPRPGGEQLLTSGSGLAVSLILALVALLAAGLTSGPLRTVAALLAMFNAGVFVANAIPSLPLDGGRFTRSLLIVQGRDAAAALVLVSRLGRACGYAFGVLAGALAVLTPASPILVLSAAFATGATGWFLVRGANDRGAPTPRLELPHATMRPQTMANQDEPADDLAA